jgi:hypothetical protein
MTVLVILVILAILGVAAAGLVIGLLLRRP